MARINLAKFKPLVNESVLLAKEKQAPNKSKIMLKMDQPSVLFLL